MPLARSTLSVALVILAVSPGLARGEGSDVLGVEQSLDVTTVLGVDILDPASDRFLWSGQGSVHLHSPTGIDLGSVAPGVTVVPVEMGSYTIVLQRSQYDEDGGIPIATYPWDVSVYDAATGAPQPGRLWSRQWVPGLRMHEVLAGGVRTPPRPPLERYLSPGG